MPKSIIEAMMCQIPVIATNIRGCREVVDHNKTGILIEPKDSVELKDAIKKIITNKKLRREYAKNGFKKSMEEYKEIDYITNQKNILNFYQKKIQRLTK